MLSTMKISRRTVPDEDSWLCLNNMLSSDDFDDEFVENEEMFSSNAAVHYIDEHIDNFGQRLKNE